MASFNLSLINQMAFRDSPPTQGAELFNKTYVQVCSEVTSSFVDGFKKQPKYSSRLPGSRPPHEIGANIILQ